MTFDWDKWRPSITEESCVTYLGFEKLYEYLESRFRLDLERDIQEEMEKGKVTGHFT